MLEHLASRFTHCACVTVLSAGVVFCSLVGSSKSAQAQGLFEALFGRSEPMFAPTLTIPYESRRPRPLTRKKSVAVRPSDHAATAALRRESGKPAPYKAPEVGPGPLGRFLNDPTLRRGDVVATTRGLMVYQGQAGARHHPREFVPIERGASLLAKHKRLELARVKVATGEAESEAVASAKISDSLAPLAAQDAVARLR